MRLQSCLAAAALLMALGAPWAISLGAEGEIASAPAVVGEEAALPGNEETAFHRPATAAEAAALLRSDGTDPSLDLTGNGTVDRADAQAVLLMALGLMDDPSVLPAILENSLLGEAYLDKFSYNGTIGDGNGNYKSDTIGITVTKRSETIEDKKVTYFVADIYLRNLACFQTAFAENTYLRSDPVENIASDAGAIIAISGDYYNQRSRGVVIRNGELYRKSVDKKRDVCVLYADGVMETYLPDEVDVDAIMARGAYQSWGFGPGLLDADGQPKTKFNTRVAARNPRSAVGYFAPGHYCFVVVDGRAQGYSFGVTMKALSQLMYDLGCNVAYNLDGGATAVMASAGGMLNHQTDNNRECSDILCIVDTDDVLRITPVFTPSPIPADTPAPSDAPEPPQTPEAEEPEA